jgi:hypothetical protein
VGVSPIAGWMGIISWGYPIFMVHKCDGSRFLPFQKWGVFFWIPLKNPGGLISCKINGKAGMLLECYMEVS